MRFRPVKLAVAPAAMLLLANVVAAQEADFLCPECDTVPGTRKSYHSGKEWPLAARPCGEPEPFIHRYHTAHYWPDPYRWNDRGAVRAYIASQRSAGWMTATTLYEQHFDPLTNELNSSGRMHLRWILIHAPASQRMTWVQTGDNAAISQVRLASAQAEAANIAGNDVCPVMLRVCQPYGASAQEVDLVRRAYLSSMPAPRIPVTLGASAGSGNNSGSNQGQGAAGN